MNIFKSYLFFHLPKKRAKTNSKISAPAPAKNLPLRPASQHWLCGDVMASVGEPLHYYGGDVKAGVVKSLYYYGGVVMVSVGRGVNPLLWGMWWPVLGSHFISIGGATSLV